MTGIRLFPLVFALSLAACGSATGQGSAADPQVDGAVPRLPLAAQEGSVPPAAYGLPRQRSEVLDPDMTLRIRCVRAPCGDLPPVSAANRVFALYHAFPDFYLAPDAAATLLTPSLKALIDKDVACADREGMCAIGADPWMAAQDGERQSPVEFATSDVRYMATGVPSAASVEVCFNFVLEGHAGHAGHAGQRRCAVVRVTRTAGEQWRVDDLVDPDGQSLRALLQENVADARSD